MKPMQLKLEPLPFQEAIDFFKDKVVLKPKQYAELEDEYKGMAFTVAGIGAMDVLNDIYSEILKALEEGITNQELGQNINAILERKGWEGLTPFRLDNIIRTNIQTAFMVGHYRRMTDPDVVENRPYWIYDAVNDKRTRPTHLALDSKVYPWDHPFWDTWFPPNGYRCRCGVRSLSESAVKRKGLTVEEEIPRMVEPPGMPARPLNPETGFGTNPAKVKWEPDLSKYPKPLQKAYNARQKKGAAAGEK